MANNSENFYAQLPVFDDFSAVFDLSNYVEIPSDWYVVVADVQNSTGAIKAGLYKAVNIVGVSVITSIRNAVKPLVVPYIFGGDGSNLCIPPQILDKVEIALISTKKMAQIQFGLNLRVGIVPVKVLLEASQHVLVARHRMSRFKHDDANARNRVDQAKGLAGKQPDQAAFAGGGMEYAEILVKDDVPGNPFRLEEKEHVTEADYTGLECRWDQVYSIHGETISLIIKSMSSEIEHQTMFYTKVVDKINKIYGSDDACRPVQVRSLHLAADNKKLSHELKVRTFMNNKIDVMKYWLSMRIENILGWLFMKFNIRTGDVCWGEYKKEVVSNTDFKKFDGVLREVISGTTKHRAELESYLQQLYINGECVYGIHATDSALITCMINNRSGDHFHFVDGSDGGYAAAAEKMKKQMRQLKDSGPGLET